METCNHGAAAEVVGGSSVLFKESCNWNGNQRADKWLMQAEKRIDAGRIFHNVVARPLHILPLLSSTNISILTNMS